MADGLRSLSAYLADTTCRLTRVQLVGCGLGVEDIESLFEALLQNPGPDDLFHPHTHTAHSTPHSALRTPHTAHRTLHTAHQTAHYYMCIDNTLSLET